MNRCALIRVNAGKRVTKKYCDNFVTYQARENQITRFADKMNKQPTSAVDTMSDHEVISRVLTGEKDMYAIIVRRYNQRLYRVGMSIINNDTEVEDVMQVTYIKAYENLGKFEFKSAFSTWLTRILINESLLRLRQRKRSVQLNDDVIEANDFKSAADTETPYMKVLNSELKTLLEKAIDQLPEKYRTVFVMREIENMNIAETKDCLDISESNVKVRLNRAKVLLKDSLNAYLKNEEVLHFHLSRCDKMVKRVMEKISSI